MWKKLYIKTDAQNIIKINWTLLHLIFIIFFILMNHIVQEGAKYYQKSTELYFIYFFIHFLHFDESCYPRRRKILSKINWTLLYLIFYTILLFWWIILSKKEQNIIKKNQLNFTFFSFFFVSCCPRSLDPFYIRTIKNGSRLLGHTICVLFSVFELLSC